MDQNNDGVTDAWAHDYDANGIADEYEFDTNYDGVVDMIDTDVTIGNDRIGTLTSLNLVSNAPVPTPLALD